MLTLREHISNLIMFLLYHPTDEVVTKIVNFIVGSIKDDDGIRWRYIRDAINRVAGDQWDTALILASLNSRVAASLNLRFSGDLCGTLEALKLNKILTDSDERNVASAVFNDSELCRTLLDGSNTVEADIDPATRQEEADIDPAVRQKFLLNLSNTLIEVIFYPRRTDFYKIARSRAGLTQAWLPGKDDDDYFGEALVKFLQAGGVDKMFPGIFSAWVTQTMANEMLVAIEKPYEKIKLVDFQLFEAN